MEVDFEGAIGRSWRFARSLERLSVMTLYIVAAVLMVLLPVAVFWKDIAAVGLEGIGALKAVQFFIWLFVAIILAVLLLLFSQIMFTHNYANPKSLTKSSTFARGKYLRFVLASFIVGIISSVGSMLDAIHPAVGAVASLVIGLVFFFVGQEIVIGGSRVMRSLRNSYALFKANWLQVVVATVVIIVLSVVIVIIAALPLLFAVIGTLTAGAPLNVPAVAVAGLLFVVGLALVTLLDTGIKTDVYMQLKKRKKL